MDETPAKLLIVDDDHNLLELMQMQLESSGYAVRAAAACRDAKALVLADAPDVAILDLQLDCQDGISLMEELRGVCPGISVIILTAHGSIESAVEAMRRGAFTYLTKPFDARELVLHVERALETGRLSSEVVRLKELLTERNNFHNIVARSASMRAVLEVVERIAQTESTVCVRGESGTGKELVARALHQASSRRDKPFIAINCAAIPETLLESELFGHEKGAFTGAVRNARGLVAQADEGVLFLDEIGDMPLSVQAKFLRVLQERRFYPLGSDQPRDVNVRVVVATNKDLEECVKQGSFREDLFYRINVIPLVLPPLRDRREDIPLLAFHFLSECSRRMNREVKSFTPQAMQRLMLHDWPGNVRELGNTIEYAAAMSGSDVITEDLILPAKSDADHSIKPLKAARESFDKDYLTRLLEITRGNVSSAATLAGKYRADLYLLLRKHGLNPADFKHADASRQPGDTSAA